jgi:FSR family fosmidomycin resistance protein-like MFS transporter
MTKDKNVHLLAVGHLVTDINQGALPAMLPFLIAAHEISFTAAAGIVFAANMTSTVVQPLFGHAADRFSKPWILCVGVLLAGTGLALTGLCRNYGMILALAVVSGIGIAAYHPQAARLVNLAAGQHKATAMSIFGIGGTVGFAVGPLLVTSSLLKWDLPGTLILLVPVSLMGTIIWVHYGALANLERLNKRPSASRPLNDRTEKWGAFTRLTLVVVGRSILFYGLNTFIPLYWIHVLNTSPAMGSTALSVMSASGIAGNLLGGRLADRLGLRQVILWGFGLLIVLMPLFVWVQSQWMALFLLFPIGFCLFATYSPTIVLGQRYLPNRIGFSSGITLGVAVAIGGAATPFLGKLADIYSVWTAVVSITGLPVLIVAMTWFLPDPEDHRRP